MTAKEQGQAIRTLLDGCRDLFGAVEPELRGEDPIEEFVYAFLLWDAPVVRADAAMKRIGAETADYNDLRVSLPHEIAAVLGERYPRVGERALRLRLALNEIFQRENAVSLATLKSRGKKEARQYIESIEGVPPFVYERVVLLCLGAHGAPVDERLLEALIGAGVVEESSTVEDAVSLLGRHIKAAEAVDAHLLLQTWVEEGGKVDDKGAPTGRRRASAAKASTRSASKSPSKKKTAGKSGRRAGSTRTKQGAKES